MLVRVVRQLNLDEVKMRIRNYEKEYSLTFEEFEELFFKKKLNRSLISVYSEWAGLVHALPRLR